jgi:hypothetical protein
MSIQPITSASSYEPAPSCLGSAEQAAACCCRGNRSEQILDASYRLNPGGIILGRLSAAGLSSADNSNLIGRIRSAYDFGRQAAANTRYMGGGSLGGLTPFKAQRDTSVYLELLSKIASGDDFIRSSMEIGRAGRGMLLDTLAAEARREIISSLGILPDDRASLSIVDSIVAAITGQNRTSIGASY